jgi:cytochrome c oxidase cbb3-type subunit III
VSRWFALILLLAACDQPKASPRPEPAPMPDPPTVTPGPVSRPETPLTPVAPVSDGSAEQTYMRLCAPCHAADLKGYAADHAPSLVNETFLQSATDEFLAKSIAQGRPGTSMGAYGKAMGGPLTDAQVTAMVAFIRQHGPAAKPLAAVGKGDPQRGAPLYAEYCQSCHGDATTRREAIHLANPAFQRHASDAFIRYGIEKGRPGTKMLAFGTTLKPQQLDDLVAFIRVMGQGAATESLLPEPTGKEPLVIHPKGKEPAWTPRAGRFVAVDEVAKAYAEGRKMIIIDARPPSDWRRVHLKGAVSIPYHDMARLSEVPKDVAVVAYCACPHHLSGLVVDELIKRGHKKAYVLDEGINAWHHKGYPVTAAAGVKPPASADPHAGHDHSHHGHGH